MYNLLMRYHCTCLHSDCLFLFAASPRFALLADASSLVINELWRMLKDEKAYVGLKRRLTLLIIRRYGKVCPSAHTI